MAIAMDLNDERFQNVLVRELHQTFCDNTKLMARSLTTEKDFVVASGTLSAIFEHRKWRHIRELPWVNLVFCAIGRGVTNEIDEGRHMINMQAYSKLVSIVSQKDWRGKFYEQLTIRLDAFYKHNADRSIISMEPVEGFLVNENPGVVAQVH
jgi:hypothetical protein